MLGGGGGGNHTGSAILTSITCTSAQFVRGQIKSDLEEKRGTVPS